MKPIQTKLTEKSKAIWKPSVGAYISSTTTLIKTYGFFLPFLLPYLLLSFSVLQWLLREAKSKEVSLSSEFSCSHLLPLRKDTGESKHKFSLYLQPTFQSVVSKRIF